MDPKIPSPTPAAETEFVSAKYIQVHLGISRGVLSALVRSRLLKKIKLGYSQQSTALYRIAELRRLLQEIAASGYRSRSKR